jgi:hypothetical protein
MHASSSSGWGWLSRYVTTDYLVWIEWHCVCCRLLDPTLFHFGISPTLS